MPEGEVPPDDGALPGSVRAGAGGRDLGVYVHIPFCAVRCGYCDFTTYTATELGGGATQAAYAATAEREVDIAAGVLSGAGLPPRPVATVFFGGGTPTLLPASDLAGLLAATTERFRLLPGAEVTTEANPESVDRAYLDALVAAGFTRLSLGMQSAMPHVLAVLERRHTPGRVAQVVAWARAAGFASVSLDLIYGTPGESVSDWRATLEAALALEPDHLSAYSLIVEPGTRLAGQIERGRIAAPEEDLHADAYLLAEEMLTAAGLAAYEVSNWARAGHECRHNLAYWRSDDWWGFGPGAHSHVGGVRWWNLRHPRDYAGRLGEGRSPAQAREVLDASQRRVERVMLELRLAEGLDPAVLTATERRRVPAVVEAGLATSTPEGRLTLTVAGRLLADAVIRDLLD